MATTQIDLRSYVFLDSLQPQHAAFLGTVAGGFLPLPGQACLYVEISPGIEINRITDIAVKSTRVFPGMQIVERLYGLLEVHSDSQADVRQAGQAILDACGLVEGDRRKPRVLSSQVIRLVDPLQAQLINRMRHGNMLVPGHSLYVMELEPAAYAALAANEAEKAAHITLVDVKPFGNFGRLTMMGSEAEAEEAQRAAVRAMETINRTAKG